MRKDALRGIGLLDSEIDVYVSLLKNGPCLASRVSADTGINRTHTYELIQKLVEKGTASYVIRENRKYFSVISPKNLLNYIDEQKRNLDGKREEISQLIPELESLKQKHEGIEVEVFKGPEGAKTILNHVFEVGRDNHVFPITGVLFDMLPVFYRNYQARMAAAGLKRWLLATEDKRGLYDGQPLVKVRYIPSEFNLPASTWVYGEYVVLFIRGEELTIVRIRSKAVSKVYMKFFKTFWNLSKK
ncbi:MAG: hypothetical protein HY544_03240 [Candidatus Diapherotrites archaeon]|uniref:Transcription regulator TrmB N-terminal domain-containing protein n=1 Tax=Candidatus Iainarchaeum sp. TaxID=3101447 RepID=A0A8T3YL22_9ARCH|nr:hypothetical protein [Candidatus Diapherotrites archaeon]